MPNTTTQKLTEIGQSAPPFNAKDQNGDIHHLKDYKGQWVVLYFYPKDSTPGCTKQACQFTQSYEEFTKVNAIILGVSPDSESSHQKFISKHKLPFPLLADTSKTLCQDYGVWQQKSMFGKKYMGVVRTTYLIDPKGKVAHRWDKVKVTKHELDVLRKINDLS